MRRGNPASASESVGWASVGVWGGSSAARNGVTSGVLQQGLQGFADEKELTALLDVKLCKVITSYQHLNRAPPEGLEPPETSTRKMCLRDLIRTEVRGWGGEPLCLTLPRPGRDLGEAEKGTVSWSGGVCLSTCVFKWWSCGKNWQQRSQG